MTLEAFMSNGGDNIAEMFSAVQEDDFPQNMHARLKSRLCDLWQKESYDELVASLETKKFDISGSQLHEHITKKMCIRDRSSAAQHTQPFRQAFSAGDLESHTVR